MSVTAKTRRLNRQGAKTPSASGWYVYIARCGDGSLYTGITTDLSRRMAEHSSGRGAKYTRGRGGVRLAYAERRRSKGRALSREAAIKRLRRAEKVALISGPEHAS